MTTQSLDKPKTTDRKNATPKTLAIDLVQIDRGTQFRSSINEPKVEEYSELFSDATEWPFDTACDVFFDGSEYYLVDGFHRYLAATKANRASILCSVHPGTLRDAIKFALSANSRHGLHRSNEDKRRAVTFVLSDSEWCKLSSRAIADMCGVGKTFVENLRSESTGHGGQLIDEKRIGKDGKERSQPKRSEPFDDPISYSEVLDVPDDDTQPSSPEGLEYVDVTEDDRLAKINKTIRPILKLLDDAKAAIKEASSTPVPYLVWDGFEKSVGKIRGDLHAAIPSRPCPYCSGPGSDCKVCDGIGYVLLRIFQQAPSDLKEKAESRG